MHLTQVTPRDGGETSICHATAWVWVSQVHRPNQFLTNVMNKILVVDDDQAVLDMLEDYFSPRGWGVFCAETSGEGLRLAFEERPDLVILDLGLPDSPGEETLRQIKTFLPEIKVIVVTGESGEGLRERLFELGSDAYFEKGETGLSAIHDKIRELLVS